jgi:hypothetical protein
VKTAPSTAPFRCKYLAADNADKIRILSASSAA